MHKRELDLTRRRFLQQIAVGAAAAGAATQASAQPTDPLVPPASALASDWSEHQKKYFRTARI